MGALSTIRTRLGARLSAHPGLWRAYRRLRRRIKGEAPAPGPIYKVLSTFATESADVRFVQVGSCDAAFEDPIIEFVREHGWRGVMVEPVPHVFGLLRARHGANPRLAFENCAIGEQEGSLPFYCMEPLPNPPSPWYNQLGSFSREHIEKHARFLPGLEQHIREIQVPCLRLSSLVAKHGMDRVDLLQIDAEGADFQVLKSLDFAACTPAILLFESGHLPRSERMECAAFLEARGYRLMYEGRDCLALHASAAQRWPTTAIVFEAHAPEP